MPLHDPGRASRGAIRLGRSLALTESLKAVFAVSVPAEVGRLRADLVLRRKVQVRSSHCKRAVRLTAVKCQLRPWCMVPVETFVSEKLELSADEPPLHGGRKLPQ
jgi:hypothetical protein